MEASSELGCLLPLKLLAYEYNMVLVNGYTYNPMIQIIFPAEPTVS